MTLPSLEDVTGAGWSVLEYLSDTPVADGIRDIAMPFADRDQTDGHQTITANTGHKDQLIPNTGSDMDWWSLVTGQEQLEDGAGLSDAVDSFIANADGGTSQTVEFKSHGQENAQEVATGEGGLISGNLTDAQAKEFARLGEVIDEDGEILMAGCNVAKDYTTHRAEEKSILDDIADASGRSVRAGVAIQLPFDGIEGSSVVVHPDGTYELDTSYGKQVYDVSANGAAALGKADSLSDGLDIAGEMAGDYWDIATDWWNGTHEAEGWDMLSPEQRAELEAE